MVRFHIVGHGRVTPLLSIHKQSTPLYSCRSGPFPSCSSTTFLSGRFGSNPLLYGPAIPFPSHHLLSAAVLSLPAFPFSSLRLRATTLISCPCIPIIAKPLHSATIMSCHSLYILSRMHHFSPFHACYTAPQSRLTATRIYVLLLPFLSSEFPFSPILYLPAIPLYSSPDISALSLSSTVLPLIIFYRKLLHYREHLRELFKSLIFFGEVFHVLDRLV